MCGIVGFSNNQKDQVNKKELLVDMLSLLQHRGPDEFGVYMSNSVNFGHSRLSILDLEHGQQPMKSNNGRFVLVYNGEIFNYRELRKELEKKSVIFKTSSDTEVLLEGFALEGVSFIKKLNGQFAFAIFDKYENKIYLSRDRFGIKPLFYFCSGDELVFSSEIKSMLLHCAVKKEINYEGLDTIINFWGLLPPQTSFKDIFQIVPGEYIIYDIKSKKYTKDFYWSFDELLKIKREKISLFEAKENTYEMFQRTIARQSISDVPVASYLSGGIDSSITALMLQQEKAEQINTFSVTFEDKQYDESNFQQDLVKKLGTKHHSINISYKDISTNLVDTIWHTETPIFRTAPVPLGLLAKKVSENNIKVVFTGEGADEIFWGYDTFKEQKIRNFWKKNPNSTIRPLLLKKLFPYLKHYNESNYEMLKMYYMESLKYDNEILFSHSVRFKNNKGVKRFYSKAIKESIDYAHSELELLDFLPNKINSFLPLERNQIIEFQTLLQGYLLSSQGDRMSMAHSVEARYPFLDNELVEFAFSLPHEYKMNGINEKFILKETFKDKLPDSIFNRSKQAYTAPDLKSFFSPDTIDFTLSILESKNILDANIWEEKAVAKLVKKFLQNRPEIISFRDNMSMVMILSSQIWYQLFFNNFKRKKENLYIKTCIEEC